MIFALIAKELYFNSIFSVYFPQEVTPKYIPFNNKKKKNSENLAQFQKPYKTVIISFSFFSQPHPLFKNKLSFKLK